MSDVPEGPDWWLGDDRRWHPPPHPVPQPGRQRYTLPPYDDDGRGTVPAASSLPDALPHIFMQLVGGTAVIVGAFLAWVTFDLLGTPEAERLGMDVDGKITVALGLAVAVSGVLAFSAARRRWHSVGALVFSVLVAIIAALDISEIRSRSDGYPVREHVGIGLWLTLLGGIAAAVGSALLLTRSPKTASAT